jgi:hypothetical protein
MYTSVLTHSGCNFLFLMLQAPEKVGLGVLDLADATVSPSAEVPIPVFVDVGDMDIASSQSEQGNVDSLGPPKTSPVPIISVTKPPAPLPVDLPTHDDITPPSPGSESHPDDIESRGSLMRQVSHPSRTTFEVSNPGQRDAPIPPPKSIHQRTATSLSGDATPSPSIPSAPITPLLNDSAPALDSPPTKPSLPADSPRQITEPLLLPAESSSINDDEYQSEDGELNASATVKFVGSGGEVGLADDQSESDQISDDDMPDETTTSMSSTSDEFFMAPTGESSERLSSVNDLGEGQPLN